MFDVIVIGGSYAGTTAALHLARGRRKVLVIDAGKRRNRFAHSSHGYLTRDGETAENIAAMAKAELLAYPTVQWIEGEALDASGELDGFTVTTSDGTHQGRRLVLATGVTDFLPELPGIAEQWGKSVFHCPYCHGYELDGPIGVLASGPNSVHQAMMLPDWGETTFLTGNNGPLTEKELGQLAPRGVTLDATPVVAVTGSADGVAVHLSDGRALAFAGLFLAPETQPTGPLADRLGCAVEGENGHRFLTTDETKATTVAGVFACGDTARLAGSLTYAVADGVLAGTSAHRSLIFPAD